MTNDKTTLLAYSPDPMMRDKDPETLALTNALEALADRRKAEGRTNDEAVLRGMSDAFACIGMKDDEVTVLFATYKRHAKDQASEWLRGWNAVANVLSISVD